MEWSAGSGLEEAPAGTGLRRLGALAAAFAEVALLAWLVSGSAFLVRQVDVSGNRHLTAAQVRTLAGLDRPGTVFTVDAATIRRKLAADAWIRDASVSPSMPGQVEVAVEEWQPAAVFVPGSGGRAFFLSDQAVVLGPAPSPSAALEVDAPGAADPRNGQRPLDVRLLTAMVNMQRGLPALVGQDVHAFEVDGCGNLTMTTQKGWKVYFGRVITPEEFASLDAKLGALKAVSTAENLNSPDVQYVNLMDASLPAVGHRPKPTPTPARGASPSPAPLPSASAPAAAPTAIPVVPACR